MGLNLSFATEFTETLRKNSVFSVRSVAKPTKLSLPKTFPYIRMIEFGCVLS